MIEKDVLRKAELPMWQIIAFYMSKTDEEKAYNITELLNGLSDIIKAKYSTLDTTKHRRSLMDVLNRHSEECQMEEPYIFCKSGNDWVLNSSGKEWVKNNIGILNPPEKNIQPLRISVLNKPSKHEQQKQEYEKYKKLKEQIEKYILENYKDVYVLGQVYFKDGYYIRLKEYAKYCIETSHFAEHGDLALVTAIAKIVQKYSTASLDVWQCLLKALGLKEIENERTQSRIKKCFIQTINFFKNQVGDSRSLNLFIDTDKKNPQNIKYHCYISNDNCIKYFDFLKDCYRRYKSQLNINILKSEILESNISKNIVNVVRFADSEQLEILLSQQIECIKQFYLNPEHEIEDKIKKDALAFELYKYLADSTSYKKALRKAEVAVNTTPKYEYDKNNNQIKLIIPKQEIYNKVSIEIIANGTILKAVNNIYICDEPKTIILEGENIKYVFGDIVIRIVSENEVQIELPQLKGKNFRFFDKNGKEVAHLFSTKGFYTYIITNKNVSINEEKDFIECNKNISEFYNLYTISLRNRNKKVIIQGITYYLSKNTSNDFDIESETINSLKSINNIDYSIKVPQIKIKDNGNIQEDAYITIINKNNNKSITLLKNNYNDLIKDENGDEFLIFDLSKIQKCYGLFESDNLYEIKYTNKGSSIIKEFLLIDAFDINFEKELYTDEKEIYFTTNKKIKLVNAEFISVNTDKYRYKYVVENLGNPNKNNPIYYEILINGKTYSLNIEIPFFLFKTNDYHHEKVLGWNEYIFEQDLNDIEISFPADLFLTMEPILKITDLNNEWYTKTNLEYDDNKYFIKKEEIINENYIKNEAYKKRLELTFRTESQEYNMELGILLNYPKEEFKFYIDDNANLMIEVKYEEIPNFPLYYREIKEDNIIFRKEEEISSNYIEKIDKSELSRDKEYKLRIYTKQHGRKDIRFDEVIQYSPATKEFPEVIVKNGLINNDKKEFLFNISYKPLDADIYLVAREGENMLLEERDEYLIENGTTPLFFPNGIKFNIDYKFSFWTKFNHRYKQIPIIYNGKEKKEPLIFNIKPYSFISLNIEGILRGDKKEFYELKKETYKLINISYEKQYNLYQGQIVFIYWDKKEKCYKEQIKPEKLLFAVKDDNYDKYKIILDKIYNDFSLVYFSYEKEYENGKKHLRWRLTTSTDDKVLEHQYKEQIIQKCFISELICSC